ncbi:hypothetical protein CHS0354_011114 [Potamilus streckersoni]|uniref:Reverse transcriptase domain-containing protein n=1 Tax=Potamilus streckersoni TaxID=2493646 RepID=A0AAE0WBK9_9BIVA|nr:hypothetical protein CHS0354_011114 [Potamilus streckersoni]
MMNRLEDLNFADDICLLPHTWEDMQKKTTMLKETASKGGLSINGKKTKSMRMNAHQTEPITLEGQALDDVKVFTYIGSKVSNKGGTDEDISQNLQSIPIGRYAQANLDQQTTQPQHKDTHIQHQCENCVAILICVMEMNNGAGPKVPSLHQQTLEKVSNEQIWKGQKNNRSL